ncbi:anaerobic C4-dicarboxylate transporter family protein [Leminorella richardii]|uniref:anaerobic C4-dicarboxylate transporter family protein n=1 Tax=Leminorella richardii TaxID=158841 RepID=UPI001E41C709|nr:anaerobic C4-dicarboxylate transporter [Leminorella richardii]
MIGARISGVGIGIAGGFGLACLTFLFHLKPSSPPINVLLIIAALVTIVSTLQAAGGLDYLVSIAERLLRRNPNRITIIGPLVAYLFTILAGTAYVSLSLYPVIAEVALEAKVRPERPISAALIAAKFGITSSPMSAATAAMLAILAPSGVSITQILLVCIPSGIIATLAASFVVYKRGLELADDPEFQRRIASGEIESAVRKEKSEVSRSAKISVWLFSIAILLVVIFGSFSSLLPTWQVGEKIVRLSVPHTIEMLMLGTSLLIVLACRVKSSKIATASTFRAGMVGFMAIFGVAWMTDTFFIQHKSLFIETFADVVKAYPWLFAVALFMMAAMLFSQGAAVVALMPLGLSLDIPAPYLVAMFAAVNGTFFFPATGTTVGAMSFDRTGTTKIGKYVLNHSFMLPGLAATVTAIAMGFVLSYFVF